MAVEQGMIVRNKAGQRLRLVGDEWRPLESASELERRQALEDLAAEQNPLQAAMIAAGRAFGGGYLSPGGDEAFRALQEASPVSTFIGQAAPAVLGAIATGGATAGAPLLARIAAASGVEAGFGALGDPEAPGQSALVGGVLGGAGAGLPAAWQAGRRALSNADLGGPGVLQAAGRVFSPSERVQARIAAAVEGAPPGGPTRTYEGLAGTLDGGPGGGVGGSSVDEAGNAVQGAFGWYSGQEALQRGIPATVGDELYLDAVRSMDKGLISRAKLLRYGEALKTSNPVLGGPIREIKDAQRFWLNDRVARDLDLPDGTMFQPAVIGQKFDELGRIYDQVAEEIGAVRFSKADIGNLEEVVDFARSTYKENLAKVHNFVADELTKSGDVLDYAGWKTIKVKLDKFLAAATRQGDGAALGDYGEYSARLFDIMMDSAGPDLVEKLARTNEQYRLLKVMTKTAGTVNPEGLINTAQFRNNLGQTPSRYKEARDDDFIRALDTLTLLQNRLVNDSGSAPRILEALSQLSNKGPGLAGSGLMAAAGYAGLNKLFGD